MDETAFDRLFSKHRKAVYALHFASAHSVEAAEDGVQETFLRIWRRLDSIREAGERSYVLQVARSVAIDASRRRKARPIVTESTQEATIDPTSGVMANLELERLDVAIRNLPVELREPFVMSVMGEMDSREIGEVLGKPPGTIRYLIHQARGRLEELR